MLNLRSCLWAAVAGAAVISSLGAIAAGMGPGSGNAVLGQALDFVVQLRIDGSEALSAECISAEVSGGERKVPASQVRTGFEVLGADLLRVRVSTLQALDEPVISVLVHVGCQTRSTRQFVVLADPPAVASPAPAPLLAPFLTTVPAATGDGGLPGAVPPAAVRAESARVAPMPLPMTARPTQMATAAQPRKLAPAAPTVTRAALRVERRVDAKTKPPAPQPIVRTAALIVATAPTPAPEPAARLKLDPSDAVLSTSNSRAEAMAVEQAIEVVTQAVSAVRAAASAAVIAEQRIALLEKSVQQMQAESKASRELALELSSKLNQADSGGRWMLPLMMALGGLSALAAWLAWRLLAAQRPRRNDWQPAAQRELSEPGPADPAEGREPTAPIPFVTAELPSPLARTATIAGAVPAAVLASKPAAPAPPPAAPAPRPNGLAGLIASPNPAPNRDRGHPAWPPAAPAQAAVSDSFSLTQQPASSPAVFERTLPASSLADLGAARDVSIEELIDLEQQAEFFVVLGQDDSAIDLLMEHLRSTGGGSPLPYLKLLEIYHRLGDRTAFERTRTRFNQRFNAYAPEWEVGLQHGRSLDVYSGVLPRLQQVWPRPLDAMAELEALLFRKSRGDLFDLPAYREVLFLYSLARDLLDREPAVTGHVDLLLPLASGSDFSSTAPYAYTGNERRPGFDGSDLDDRPTAPVDLDLTAADKPGSIFDPFDEKSQSGRR